jgi:leader peptidase (prepilin peptidase)/N-methyltransferase
VRRGFQRFRGQAGLGFGDVKLITALAFWLGLATPWAVVAAAGIGLAFAVLRGAGRRNERFAFGPMIAAAAWIVGMTREAGLWPVGL